MEDEHSAMLKAWQERQELFSQCYELQLFLRDAEQRDTWINTKEAFLANQDLGVNMIICYCLYLSHSEFMSTFSFVISAPNLSLYISLLSLVSSFTVNVPG